MIFLDFYVTIRCERIGVQNYYQEDIKNEQRYVFKDGGEYFHIFKIPVHRQVHKIRVFAR